MLEQQTLPEVGQREVVAEPAKIDAAPVTRHPLVAFLPILLVLLCAIYGESWAFSRGGDDLIHYQCYSVTFWLGQNAAHLLPPGQCNFLPPSARIGFHAFPIEYPPLTLFFFSLPVLAPPALYPAAFALWLALIAAGIYWLLLRYAPSGSAPRFALYLLIGSAATAFARFDLIPAVLTLLCVIAAERKRWTLAYCVLALAVLLKFYPVILWPVLFLSEQQATGSLPSLRTGLKRTSLPATLWQTFRTLPHWKWRNTCLFAVIIAVVMGLFALYDTQNTLISPLQYFFHRPTHIESVAGSITWLASLIGIPMTWRVSFATLNVFSPLTSIISVGMICVLAAGYAFILWQQWRHQLDLAQGMIAVLLLLLTTGKVFCPQYLLWVMPLLVYSGIHNAFWHRSWCILSLLTTIIYPLFYILIYMNASDEHHIMLAPGFLPVITLRNMLFTFLTLSYLFNWWQVRKRPVQRVQNIRTTTALASAE